MKYRLAPSILSADFSHLAEEMKKLEQNGIQIAHIDIFDGHFAPNLSIGPAVVRSIRPYFSGVFDVHLMLTNPLNFIQAFCEAGADNITVHVESNDPVEECFQLIRSFGVNASLTLNPDTKIETLFPYLPFVDMVLIMSVFPGFSGQKFMETSYDRLDQLSQFKKEQKLSFDIEVDGGVSLANVERLMQHGANIFVAGSAYFDSKQNVAKEFEMIFNKAAQ